MRHPLSQSGFSLIEIIIASIILAIVVGSSLTFMGNTETKDTFGGTVQGTSACLLEANKILANIKEKGQARTRLNFPAAQIAGGTYRFLNNTILDQIGQSTSEFGIPFAHRWPAPADSQIYETQPAAPGNAFVLRPNLLIMGYMSAMQAMYNSNSAGFCTGSGMASYVDDGGIENIITANTNPLLNHPTLGNATSRLRIQIFNTNSGATSCPARVNIGPRGTDNSTANYRRRPRGLSIGVNHPDNNNEEVFDHSPTNPASTNLGFLVTARVNYTDRSGQAKSCSVQEKFQYTTQPQNSMTLEFEDIDTPAPVPATNPSSNDSNIAEGINTTIRTTDGSDFTQTTVRTNAGNNSPTFSASGAAAHQFAGPNRPIYYGCGENTPNPSSVVLRLTRTRSGSIHMCRNLSVLRTARELTGGANPLSDPEHGTLWDYEAISLSAAKAGFAVRIDGNTIIPVVQKNITAGLTNTFYSTELIQPEITYYARKHMADNNTFMTGLFYPQGTYYCLNEDNCGGGGSAEAIIRKALPRFPRGSYRPNDLAAPAPVAEGGFRYHHPLTRTGAGTAAATSTTANWIPCEQLTNICNTPGALASAGFKAENGPNQRDAYEMRYNNLPSGCEVHIQVAEVDAGYNISATEFREYVQEKTPGNWVCRNGTTGNGIFNNKDSLTPHAPPSVAPGYPPSPMWFFACAPASPAPLCGDVGPSVDCCLPFPMFPRYKATHPN